MASVSATFDVDLAEHAPILGPIFRRLFDELRDGAWHPRSTLVRGANPKTLANLIRELDRAGYLERVHLGRHHAVRLTAAGLERAR